jgi:hypothetical protein
MRVSVIGIDCATKDDKVGIARGSFVEGQCNVDQVLVCSKATPLERTVTRWIPDHDRVLLAFDAPLGWPAPMGRTLVQHHAGEAIVESGNILFRRSTDRFVKAHLGQQSLDVGADRIARTALSALALLGKLRQATGQDIPLAWNSTFPERIAAIEVYPAATLVTRNLSSKGYKRRDQVEARQNILSRIHAEVEFNTSTSLLETHADALDAALCVLAAADFLADLCYAPNDPQTCEKEGWIWVRRVH